MNVVKTYLGFFILDSPFDSYQQIFLLFPVPGNLSLDMGYVKVQGGGWVRAPSQPLQGRLSLGHLHMDPYGDPAGQLPDPAQPLLSWESTEQLFKLITAPSIQCPKEDEELITLK